MNLRATGVPTTLRRNRLHAALGLVLAGVLVAAGVLALPALGQPSPANFSTIRDVPLPGDTSRFDYESLDPLTHRLYVSHLGAGTIAVYHIPSFRLPISAASPYCARSAWRCPPRVPTTIDSDWDR